ncbi:MAG: helix-turn-helix domain-containing protein [Thermacetogeniaceae bacterium]|jgi:transcriptional regulator with XRE-family HTH domain|nr:helix-turn-helix transcriptional regulator [Thermoanaerobacterales bacterium]NLN21210.1 helix-turn-helix transcriptional regulator [Syntrophomonadaceae bacterium]
MTTKLGTKLRNMRKIRDLTAEELSKLSGVSRSYILLIETGKRKEVSNKVLDKLAKALRVDANYFKIDDASLPTEVLPDMPPEIMDMIISADSMPYLKLTQKAKESGISPETLNKVIDILIDGLKK